MFKQVCFFKKRPDKTIDQFIDYYENMHSKFRQRMGIPRPSAEIRSRYLRRYIRTPEKNPLTLERVHPGYECVMETWWDNRQHFEEAMAALQKSKHLPDLIEDEHQLFASNSNPVCSVEELETPLGPNGSTVRWVPVREGEKEPETKGLPADVAGKTDREFFKQVCFLKKRDDMTMEQFKEYYEKRHSQLTKAIDSPFLKDAVRYVRRYITVERNPVTWEKHHPGYDCVMEVWWKNRADFERSNAGIHDPKYLAQWIEDEKKLFATHNNPVVTVEEHDEKMGPNDTMIRWMPTLA